MAEAAIGPEQEGVGELMLSLRELERDEQRFQRYDFQRPETHRRLDDACAGGDMGAVVLLAGRTGIGRGYLLEAFAERQRRRGEKVLRYAVGLDRFEPEPPRWGGEGGGRTGGGTSFWMPLASSLPAADDEPAGAIETAGEARLRVLARLRALTAHGRAVVHLRDANDLPPPLLADLGTEALRIPGLILVISCAPWRFTGLEPPLPVPRATRIELRELSRAELDAAIDRAFPENRFDPPFRRRLWSISRGVPAIAAAALRASVAAAGVAPDAGGRWRALPRQLAFPERRPAGTALDRFLSCAALCGGQVPADLAVGWLGLSGDAADRLLDAIDDRLLASGIGVFEDLQYSHSGFPSHPVYRFADSTAALVVDHLFPPEEEQAVGLLRFLEQRLAVPSRSAARLLLAVASRSGSVAARSRILHEVDWWVAEPDMPALVCYLENSIASREIAAESVWAVFQATATRWPPGRRLALLTAYERQPGGVVGAHRSEFLRSRAAVLRACGRSREARSDAVEALDLLTREPGAHPAEIMVCRAVLGSVLRDLGEPTGARRELEQALTIARTIGPEGVPLLHGILRTLSDTLCDLGELGQARHLLEDGIASAREHDPDPRKTSLFLRRFAQVARQLGDLAAARSALEEALHLDRGVFGDRSPELAAPLRNLADLLIAFGEKEAAARALGEALEVLEAAAAAGPEIEIVRSTLVETLVGLGEWARARRHLAASLEALGPAEAAGPGERRRRSVLLRRLGDLAVREGDHAAARDCFERALAVEESLPASETTRSTILKTLADVDLELGEVECAAARLVRAGEVEESLYGADDPRLVPNLDYLAAVLLRLGRRDDAAALRARVEAIVDRAAQPAT